MQINQEVCKQKIMYVMDSFQTQRSKDWFTADALLSILRIRGIESRAPEKYAEGFYCRKVVI
jgi:hypothetical protein